MPSVENLPSLEYLDLSDNDITEIPTDFLDSTKKLVSVYFDYNHLTSFDWANSNSAYFELLSFSYNNFTSFDPLIDNLKNVNHLNIDHNQIKELPSGWYRLSYLKANNNEISSVPGVSFFSSLQPYTSVLDLSYNSISELPASFKSLIHLSSLYLSHNSLKTLPKAMASVSVLKVMDVSYNQIIKLPVLPSSLSLIDASNNKIMTPSILNLTGFYYLTSLNLGTNMITNISSLKKDYRLAFINLTDNCVDCKNASRYFSISSNVSFICDNDFLNSSVNTTKCKLGPGTTDGSVVAVTIAFNCLLVVSILISNCLMLKGKK